MINEKELRKIQAEIWFHIDRTSNNQKFPNFVLLYILEECIKDGISHIPPLSDRAMKEINNLLLKRKKK